ncbi:hypothetical protein LZK98_18435 [Sphingomonas cannabina]|uniref:hypothetical protein n=1 Tax=Sphingomonas cannabina TaxID=2899123 RepID=UPI001F1E1B79|nr:hypothetical protein [Sphingomonas cannabina]UIJ45006.1 hypothetical protein LZK98_18435 [Sphingomonas cannabina]
MASRAMTKDVEIQPYGLRGDLALPRPDMGLVASTIVPESIRAIVSRAGHLFEESGTLDQVILLARDWFVRNLGSAP